jgi:hypothetical protein
MRRPELGFAARETAFDTYKFQLVVYTASRNGQDMTKTFDPHARLLSEQETKQLGYDTDQLIYRSLAQRVSVTTKAPEYSDLPKETFDEFQMKHQWDMLTEDNEALLRDVFPELMPETHQPGFEMQESPENHQ